MKIRIFVTGGTFDKEYDELTGQLDFRDTHVPKMLALGRCKLDVLVRTAMLIDSLEMTEGDRQFLLAHIRREDERQIVVTHGTDTLVETARLQIDSMIQVITGVRVKSLHHDISTVTGEEVVLFTLERAPTCRDSRQR